ncbi:hypothetical protein H6G33_09940 [Calothrix sp. FACHB-1219]|uniref:hypothetical protein n=1 Tax=unclassified Calothrix TaxID=2619626 RepID=UPI0016872A24|nr:MULTISPECIES: hypothetical protein [unclassified Calothrix]MBD2201667.1 hypothetical protein [Calothrix sp. FACHB-168]MBD2217353.1 hypothetical protein [Calothrix sp. FACHB-1219]
MKKVIRDGKVAVLYSPEYGAGWYSWHKKEELLFLPELVEILESSIIGYKKLSESRKKEIIGTTLINTGRYTYYRYENESDSKFVYVDEVDIDNSIYLGGCVDLTIEWIPKGLPFRVREYDGFETIDYGETGWIIS